MNNPFRNLVKKSAKHEKGEIVVADSGNVKEVAKIMIGFERFSGKRSPICPKPAATSCLIPT